MMNKQKGNMYPFVTHTWNPIKGKCPHDCSYCYMKVFPQGKLRFDEKCMKDDLGSGNYIFVGSSTDMFASDVPTEWIKRVLEYCMTFDNKYLFQTKRPIRFNQIKGYLQSYRVILGTTIESNREYNDISKAPDVFKRVFRLKQLSERFNTMVSIEPILDFDVEPLVGMIKNINPQFVSIGADSKGHNLPEPPKEKINDLIKELKKFTNVKIKDNLRRLGDYEK